MKTQRNITAYCLKVSALLLVFLPLFASAQYRPIVGIPGVSGGNFSEYINSIYALSISIAALLAVIKIIIAGVKWMMTDIVTSKADAKRDIQGALLGLLVVLSAVLILSIINSDLASGGVGASGGSGLTPQTPPPPRPALSPAYTVNSAPGYTWISSDENYINRGDFENNCDAAGNSLYYAYDAGQIRCLAPTASQEATIRGYVPTGPSFSSADQDQFLEAYMDYVNPAAVDSTTLSAIETSLEAERGEDWDVYFAIDTSLLSPTEATQFESICEDVDQALGTNGFTGEQRVQITGSGTYLVCATLNE